MTVATYSLFIHVYLLLFLQFYHSFSVFVLTQQRVNSENCSRERDDDVINSKDKFCFLRSELPTTRVDDVRHCELSKLTSYPQKQKQKQRAN